MSQAVVRPGTRRLSARVRRPRSNCTEFAGPFDRHRRACPGDLWIAGSSPAMTENARLATAHSPGYSGSVGCAGFCLPGRAELIRCVALMAVLTTSLDRRSEMFAANAVAMRALVADLREKVA